MLFQRKDGLRASTNNNPSDISVTQLVWARSSVSSRLGTNQESGFPFMLLVSKLCSLFHLVRQNSQLSVFSTKDSFPYLLNYSCVISSSTFVCYQLKPLTFLKYLFSDGFFTPDWLSCGPSHPLYGYQKDQATNDSNNHHFVCLFVCLVLYMHYSLKSNRHTHQISITSIFHMRKPKLSEIKNLIKVIELL